MCENVDLTGEIKGGILLADPRLRRYGLSLYGQSTALLRLKVRMPKADVLETMFYEGVTWSPTVVHVATLHIGHHRLLPL